MAMRLPGDLRHEHELWQALLAGRDLVSQIDPARWATDTLQHPSRGEPGRSITFAAGVLSGIDQFDAGFFGISPREAQLLDPQQRLLLELSWEALEDAGLPPSRLAGSDCAVYLGISGLDYGMRVLDDLSVMGAHSMTGNTMSVAANRLSYVFDLHGPSVAVDTACSSSLVALHHACAALQRGEAGAALVGGVNVLLHPYPFVGFTKASMLSAQGRCRPFSEGADGYVRAEGAVMLLLKPLEQALRDGDRIHGVVRASGVNTDGARKSGLTIPSGQAQAELMRRVLAQAALQPTEVDYLEAHGTGTRIGDPIEASAISAAYARAREGALPIGSIKSNLGHLEPASGMAGLLKALLVLKHGVVPPTLVPGALNPDIDFQALGLQVVREPQALPRGGRPLRAGVNSFGFGGVNAHVVLEQAPLRPHPAPAPTLAPAPASVPAPAPEPAAPLPLLLSAHDEAALRQLAGHYAALLRQHEPAAVAQAAWHGRERLPEGLLLPQPGDAAAAQALQRFADGGPAAPELLRERRLGDPGTAAPLAWIYSGNGAQWVGMGRRLRAASPLFDAALRQAADGIAACGGPDVLAALDAPGAQTFDDTAVAQPALFALQVAATEWLRASGLRAEAAMGHSVGEIAAAWSMGMLDLPGACRVIVARSAAQATTRGSGRMAAVGLGAEAMAQRIAALGLGDAVEVAADNGPAHCTVSGSPAALRSLHEALRGQPLSWQDLDLDYAFHSRAMDALRQPLLGSLGELRPQAGHGRMYSSVTGGVLAGPELDADYWWRNVRACVRFGPALRAMAADGLRLFLEIGPHAILQRYLREGLQAAGTPGRALAIAPRREDTLERLQEAARRALLLGARVDAGAAPARHQTPPLPAYPWQRQRHWFEPSTEAYRLLERRAVHPLLGARLHEHPAAWEQHVDPRQQAWLADHKVGAAIVLPAAAYVEMALAASRECFADAAGHTLEGLDIVSPVVFDGEHARTLRLVFHPQDLRFHIEGRQRLSSDAWTLHAQGRLRGPAPAGESRQPLLALEPARSRVPAEAHYKLCERLGLDYGPAFRGIGHIDVAARSLHAQLGFDAAAQAAQAGWMLAPQLLDQAFQSVLGWLGVLRESQPHADRLGFLPVGIGRLDLWLPDGPAPASVTQLRARLVRTSPRSVLVDFELLDASQRVLARLRDCRFRAAALVAQDHAIGAWTTQASLRPLACTPPGPPLACLQTLLQRMAAQTPDPEQQAQRTRYLDEAAPLLELLPLAYARDALRPCAGAPIPEQELQQWQARHPLLHWLLQLLREEGLLLQTPGGWQLHDDPQLPPAADIWRAALASCPQAAPELLQAGRTGEALPGWLAGETAPAVGADGGALLRSPAYASTDHDMLRALAALAGHWPAGRRLRVLELYCGGDSLFPEARLQLDTLCLPQPQDVDWVAACADPEALAGLQALQAEDPRLRAVALDTPLLQPELPEDEGAFDLVLLRHLLHRAEQPRQALHALSRRMRADAWLLLGERRPDHAAQFTLGLDLAWWQATDTAPQPSLRSPGTWSRWLQEQGWSEVQALQGPAPGDPEEVSTASLLGSFTVLARPPRDAGANTAATTTATIATTDTTTATTATATISPPPGASATAEPAAPAAGATAATAWCLQLLHPGWRDTAEALAQALRRAGHAVQVHSPEAGEAAAPQLLQAPRHVLFVGTDSPAAGAAEVARQAEALRRALLALAAAPEGRQAWVVGRGGSLIDDTPADAGSPATAALWGLARVAANECHPLRLHLVDMVDRVDRVDPATSGDEVQAQAERLLDEVLHGDGEEEVRLRRHDAQWLRQAPRLRPASLQAAAAQDDPAAAWRLDFRLPGQLRNLQWQQVPRRDPGPGEVEIRAMAAGLNFRDIMYAMGLLADEAVEQGFAGASLGLEVAGRVLRCGPGVRELRPGDEVLAFAGASFASHVVVPERAVARKPAHWSFAEAATVPTVFFTVWYALKHLAHLQRGERVLVHGAAGGVGLAAIQIARLLGAEVYASAGSPAKREFVRLCGAHHVVDSRSLDFDREVLRASEGQGVDVVLNSLAGEAITRNLMALKPFGRFIELGKRDFYENTPVGLRPFRNNLSYFGVDADQLMQLRPELAREVFTEVMQAFADGQLHPLPHRVFPAEQAVDAFRHMQQARQIGKVVLALDRAPRLIHPAQPPRLQLRPEATYLVSGGLGGFGLATAQWLAERGARHLALLGRRGLDTPGLAEALPALREAGVQVRVLACDVSQREALATALRDIQATMPPLRGVVHAAMVLDDALLSGLDEQRLRRVLQPKLDGAWNLHELTREQALDLFVLYSSATTLLGNPGQANYVAANAALEALARLRRAQGLPACAPAWGPIADVGVLTTNTVARDSLATRLGAPALPAREALAMLERLLLQGLPGAAVLDFSWSALQRLLPAASAQRFAALREQADPDDQAGEQDLRRRIAELAPEPARELVLQQLCREVAGILRLPADKLSPEQSVFDLGMDSLMAVELGLALERRFGIRVPPMLLNENPSIQRIAERLLAALGPQQGAEDQDPTRHLVHGLLAQHAEAAAPALADELAAQVRETAESGARLIA